MFILQNYRDLLSMKFLMPMSSQKIHLTSTSSVGNISIWILEELLNIFPCLLFYLFCDFARSLDRYSLFIGGREVSDIGQESHCKFSFLKVFNFSASCILAIFMRGSSLRGIFRCGYLLRILRGTLHS